MERIQTFPPNPQELQQALTEALLRGWPSLVPVFLHLGADLREAVLTVTNASDELEWWAPAARELFFQLLQDHQDLFVGDADVVNMALRHEHHALGLQLLQQWENSPLQDSMESYLFSQNSSEIELIFYYWSDSSATLLDWIHQQYPERLATQYSTQEERQQLIDLLAGSSLEALQHIQTHPYYFSLTPEELQRLYDAALPRHCFDGGEAATQWALTQGAQFPPDRDLMMFAVVHQLKDHVAILAQHGAPVTKDHLAEAISRYDSPPLLESLVQAGGSIDEVQEFMNRWAASYERCQAWLQQYLERQQLHQEIHQVSEARTMRRL